MLHKLKLILMLDLSGLYCHGDWLIPHAAQNLKGELLLLLQVLKLLDFNVQSRDGYHKTSKKNIRPAAAVQQHLMLLHSLFGILSSSRPREGS
jgi:hypothetical protein